MASERRVAGWMRFSKVMLWAKLCAAFRSEDIEEITCGQFENVTCLAQRACVCIYTHVFRYFCTYLPVEKLSACMQRVVC